MARTPALDTGPRSIRALGGNGEGWVKSRWGKKGESSRPYRAFLCFRSEDTCSGASPHAATVRARAWTAGSGTEGSATTSPRRRGTGRPAGTTARISGPRWRSSTPCRTWFSCCAIKATLIRGLASTGRTTALGNGQKAPNSTTCFQSKEMKSAFI